METAQLEWNPLDGVARLVWRPVQKVAELARQLQEAAEQVGRQIREVAQLVLRAADGVALHATRVRARSQVEMMFGPLTVSFASGVILARPGEAPEYAPGW
ncbi:MAG: hypothetical protein ACRDTE_26375 [Pseudonocardiaceae bacterium]